MIRATLRLGVLYESCTRLQSTGITTWHPTGPRCGRWRRHLPGRTHGLQLEGASMMVDGYWGRTIVPRLSTASNTVATTTATTLFYGIPRRLQRTHSSFILHALWPCPISCRLFCLYPVSSLATQELHGEEWGTPQGKGLYCLPRIGGPGSMHDRRRRRGVRGIAIVST